MSIRLLKSLVIALTVTVLQLSAGISAFAQEVAAVPPPRPAPSLLGTLAEMSPMFAAVFLIFYVMVMKPQQAKLKAQETLMSNLKKGDTVVTGSGMIGRVAGIEKDHILLEVSSNVKVKFESSAIVRNLDKEKSAATPAVAS